MVIEASAKLKLFRVGRVEKESCFGSGTSQAQSLQFCQSQISKGLTTLSITNNYNTIDNLVMVLALIITNN